MIFTSLYSGCYECISDSGEHYIVDIENKTCSCKGYLYKKKCEHLDFFQNAKLQ